MKALWSELSAQIQVDDSRLDPGHPVGEVDREHTVHSPGRHDDRTPQRDRATGESGSGTPWDHGPAVGFGNLHDCHDIVSRFRETHRPGYAAVEHGGVMRCK